MLFSLEIHLIKKCFHPTHLLLFKPLKSIKEHSMKTTETIKKYEVTTFKSHLSLLLHFKSSCYTFKNSATRNQNQAILGKSMINVIFRAAMVSQECSAIKIDHKNSNLEHINSSGLKKSYHSLIEAKLFLSILVMPNQTETILFEFNSLIPKEREKHTYALIPDLLCIGSSFFSDSYLLVSVLCFIELNPSVQI